VFLAPGAHAAPPDGRALLQLMSLPGLLIAPAGERELVIPDVAAGPHTLIALVEGPTRAVVRAAAAPVDVPAYGEVEVLLEVPPDAPSFELAGTP
jgi:hypothetical protein